MSASRAATMTASLKRYITVREAAEYSSLGQSTIRMMLAAGTLTAYRPRPGRVLIDMRQLDAVIQSSSQTSGTRGAHMQQA